MLALRRGTKKHDKRTSRALRCNHPDPENGYLHKAQDREAGVFLVLVDILEEMRNNRDGDDVTYIKATH